MNKSDQSVTCTIPLPDEAHDTWLDQLSPSQSSFPDEVILPPPPRWDDELEVESW